MKIELKRVTYNARLSQETSAYAADIWVDGVKRGSVMNDGQGGADMIRPWQLEQAIDAYAKTLPPVPIPYGEPLENCAELLLGDLLDEWKAARELKRLLRTKGVIAREGKIYTCQPTSVPTFTSKQTAGYRKYPSSTSGITKAIDERLSTKATP